MVPRQSSDLPEPPEGWQYGVVMKDQKVWACGTGDDGRAVQRMRMRYEDTACACLIGPEKEDKT